MIQKRRLWGAVTPWDLDGTKLTVNVGDVNGKMHILKPVNKRQKHLIQITQIVSLSITLLPPSSVSWFCSSHGTQAPHALPARYR